MILAVAASAFEADAQLVSTNTINFYKTNGQILPIDPTVKPVNAPASWSALSRPWGTSFAVPFTHQPDDYTCGPTSLSMTMAHYGTVHDVPAIANYMSSIGNSPYTNGVGESTILAAVKHYGFSGAVITNGWDNLKAAIQNHLPCITHMYISATNYPLYYPDGKPVYSSYTGGHYIVTCGLHADRNGNVDYVIVNDPAKGQALRYTSASFEKSWSAKNCHFIRLR